jgi:hypothetical protein
MNWFMNSRAVLLLGLLLVGLNVLLLVYRSRGQRALANSRQQWLECQRLSEDLIRFRNAPRLAALEVEPPDRIARRIASSMEAAELPPSSLLAIAPEPPTRLGQSAYLSRATHLTLKELPLASLAKFAINLEDGQGGMLVRDLTLERSRNASDSGVETWNVRLTLTQAIFSPISQR